MALAFNSNYISYKPKINSRTVQGERNAAGALKGTGSQEGKENKDGEGATGQSNVPGESWADVFVHGFWNWITSSIFYLPIFNVDTSSYLRQKSAKDPGNVRYLKKYNYIYRCMEIRRSFTPMV